MDLLSALNSISPLLQQEFEPFQTKSGENLSHLILTCPLTAFL